MRTRSAAGVAVRDITPPIGIELVGYHRPHPSDSVLDRLMATAFESSDRAAVLVTVDNAGMLVSHTNELRQRVADALGLPRSSVMVCFSHTHSGPETSDGKPEWVKHREYLMDQAVDAAREAWRARRQCHAGWGVTRAPIGINRRILGPDGKAVMGANPDGLVDDRIGVFRIEEAEGGRPIGLVVVCAAHGNVLCADSTAISADYIGWARRLLSEDLGCPVGFVMSSCGDVNARHRGSVSDLDKTARLIQHSVAPLLRQVRMEETFAVESRSSVLRMRLTSLPSEGDAAELATLVAREWGVDTSSWLQTVSDLRRKGVTDPEIDLEVQALRLSEGLLAGVPLEPFAQIAAELVSMTGSTSAFLCGYTNGYLGYLPTREEHRRGGYEVEWMPVVYGQESGFLMPPVPETADRILRHILRLSASQ